MMKLSLMNRFFATADQEYRSPIADLVAAPWRPDPGTVRVFRASANFVCVFRRDGARQFLRFNTVEERNPAWLADEVTILNYLAEHGIPVSVPVKSEAGNYIELVSTELGAVAAVAFTGLAGDELELADATNEQLAAWGAALGRLHQALKGMPSQLALHRPSWQDMLDFARPFVAQLELPVQHELSAVEEGLAVLPRGADDFGVIHFDFESDNLCWDNGTVAALDFDDCARLWYAADIGYALRDLFKGGPVDPANQRLAAFLRGYRSQTTLSEAMLANLPLFMRLHRLFFIARLKRALDIVDRTEVPDWVVKLCDKLSATVLQYVEDIRNGESIVR